MTDDGYLDPTSHLGEDGVDLEFVCPHCGKEFIMNFARFDSSGDIVINIKRRRP